MIKQKLTVISKLKFDLKEKKIYFLGAVVGLLVIASIFMTIESSTDGSEFANLQNKEVELLTAQQELQQILVDSLSVNRLQEQSTALGFVKINNLVYVTSSEAVAKLP